MAKVTPHYHGHRNRLRNKLMENSDALADYELLEMILMQILPRGDVKPLAKMLIAHFGSLADVITAPSGQISEIKGAGLAVATSLKLIHQTSLYLLKHQIAKQHVLSSWQQVLDYCRVALAYCDREQFCMIYLDRKNYVICDEIIQSGTIDHVVLYPREIVKSALDKGATALIMVHNHPSGSVEPSKADIQFTTKIAEALKPLDIALHDHLIISRNNHYSFQQNGLLRD